MGNGEEFEKSEAQMRSWALKREDGINTQKAIAKEITQGLCD